MMRGGAVLMVAAFVLFVIGGAFATYLVALMCLGLGLGLVRPGSAAAASLSVEPNEQGSVAGMLGGVAVIGNVFGLMLGTALYTFVRSGPFILNAAIMVGATVLIFRSRRVGLIRA